MCPKSLIRSVLHFCLIPKFMLVNTVPPCWRWKQWEGEVVLQEMNSGLKGEETSKWKSPTSPQNVKVQQEQGDTRELDVDAVHVDQLCMWVRNLAQRTKTQGNTPILFLSRQKRE